MMENANLSFIHPEKRVDIYGGLALLALATGGLFTRFESVKIVAMATLSSQAALLSSALLRGHQNGDLWTPISPEQMKLDFVRSQNGIVRTCLKSCIVTSIIMTLGAFLALAARAPFPGLKQTVTMKQLSPFCLSGLAMAAIAADIQAKRVSQRDDTGNFVSIEEVVDRRFNAFCKIAVALMYATIVGTIAFRAGIFSTVCMRQTLLPRIGLSI